MVRRGMCLGSGKKGYYNVVPRDTFVHALSAKGIKSTSPFPINHFYKRLKSKDIEPFNLPIQTAIIVPSTKADPLDPEKQVPVKVGEFDKRVVETKDTLREFFGGYTNVSAMGGFKDDDGTKIEEPVIVVTSYAPKKEFYSKTDSFIDYVTTKKKEWNQKSMGVIIENDLLYI